MGLFGFGGNDEEEDNGGRELQLEKESKGNSVTAKRLTTTNRGYGAGRDFLAGGPVIDLVKENEQPHFLFLTDGIGGHKIQRRADTDIEPNGKYRVIIVITDERILLCTGNNSGDRSHTINYNDIAGVGYDKSEVESVIGSTDIIGTLKLQTDDDSFYFQSAKENAYEIRDAAEYILEKSDLSGGSLQSGFEIPKTEAQKAKERVEDRLSVPEKTSKGPQPVHSGKGGKVRIKGNKYERINCGGVEIYEDKIKIQKKGMVNQSWITVPIHEIHSVDSTAFGKVSIVTDANDYKISGCSIATQLVKFVNEWKENPIKDSENKPDHKPQNDTVSAAEEVEKLAELNERGIITDEEFKKKKEDLI